MSSGLSGLTFISMIWMRTQLIGNGWLSDQNLLGGAGENVKSQLEGKGTTWPFGLGAQKALTEPTGLSVLRPDTRCREDGRTLRPGLGLWAKPCVLGGS